MKAEENALRFSALEDVIQQVSGGNSTLSAQFADRKNSLSEQSADAIGSYKTLYRALLKKSAHCAEERIMCRPLLMSWETWHLSLQYLAAWSWTVLKIKFQFQYFESGDFHVQYVLYLILFRYVTLYITGYVCLSQCYIELIQKYITCYINLSRIDLEVNLLYNKLVISCSLLELQSVCAAPEAIPEPHCHIQSSTSVFSLHSARLAKCEIFISVSRTSRANEDQYGFSA